MIRSIISAVLFLPLIAHAGEPVVVGVESSGEPGSMRFDVTVAHEDTGWDHYADAWEVRRTDGEVLGRRDLAHPHETEQPFTRSLTGVAIPEGVSEVEVIAHDSVHGWGEAVLYVLP